MPFVHLSRDGAGSGRHPHLCHLRKGDLRPGSGRQQQVADLLRRVAALVVEAADYVVALAADENLRDGGPADRQLNQIGHIGDIQAILRNAIPIGDDLQLRQRWFLIDRHIHCAGDLFQEVRQAIRQMPTFHHILAINLQRQVAMRPGNLIHHHVDNGL